jgi:phosphate starvation-inducible membrane PsiE
MAARYVIRTNSTHLEQILLMTTLKEHNYRNYVEDLLTFLQFLEFSVLIAVFV